MVSRQVLALLAVVALVAGPAWYFGPGNDSPPTLTVENGDTVPYDVTAYAAEDRQSAMLMNFEVTTRDGDRRLATGEQLYWAGEFRNVTLADDGVPTTRLHVASGENETVTMNGCGSGAVTIMIFEALDGNESHEWTHVESCSPQGNEHTITLREGGMSG